MSANPKFAMTPEEYFAFESASDEKHEYIEGEIYAMTGGSTNHSRLAAALIMLIGMQLRKRPCEVFTSDHCVKVNARTFFYPDVTVVCGDPVVEMRREVATLFNPTVVIEVLSPSTENYDRWTKAARYRSLPSLQDYLFIAQDTMGVELRSRRGDGEWLLQFATEPDAVIQIASIDCTLVLADIYEKVHFPPAEPNLRDE